MDRDDAEPPISCGAVGLGVVNLSICACPSVGKAYLGRLAGGASMNGAGVGTALPAVVAKKVIE